MNIIPLFNRPQKQRKEADCTILDILTEGERCRECKLANIAIFFVFATASKNVDKPVIN